MTAGRTDQPAEGFGRVGRGTGQLNRLAWSECQAKCLDPLLQAQAVEALRRSRSTGPRDTLARTKGQASISVSSPFSGARRPTKTARGVACQSGRRCQAVSGTGTPLGIVTIRALSGCDEPLPLIVKAASFRSARPLAAHARWTWRSPRRRPPGGSGADRPAKLPHDCQATSPVAPAPSGRSTTGKPSRSPAPITAISIVLEHRDVRQVDRVLLKPPA